MVLLLSFVACCGASRGCHPRIHPTGSHCAVSAPLFCSCQRHSAFPCVAFAPVSPALGWRSVCDASLGSSLPALLASFLSACACSGSNSPTEVSLGFTGFHWVSLGFTSADTCALTEPLFTLSAFGVRAPHAERSGGWPRWMGPQGAGTTAGSPGAPAACGADEGLAS